MINASSIFPNASLARTSGFTYVVIHQEARAIENAILQAIQSGLYSVYIVNTFMTDTILSSWVTVGSFNTSTDVISLSSHGFSTGQEVQFSTAGTMPSPFTTSAIYYVIVIDTNSFKLASSFTNAISNVPIHILTTGSGTIQIRATSTAAQYYETWQGSRDDRGQTTQMNGVISYFEDLGYQIYRQTNPTVPGVFMWVLKW